MKALWRRWSTFSASLSTTEYYLMMAVMVTALLGCVLLFWHAMGRWPL